MLLTRKHATLIAWLVARSVPRQHVQQGRERRVHPLP